MTIKALYPNADDTGIVELVMEYETLTVGEMTTLERQSGKFLAEFEDAVREGSRSDLCLLFYVFRKRNEPKLTLADVHAMPYHALVFVQVKADGEDGDEGKAPSVEPDTDTPTA